MSESIVFINGKPGAGKSTCCKAAVEYSKLSNSIAPIRHLSSGDLFRKIFHGQIESRYSHAVADSRRQTLGGELADSKLVHDIVMEFLEELPTPGVTLVDGFPKEPQNLELIKENAKDGKLMIYGCVIIAVEDETAINRQIQRPSDGKRDDYDQSVAEQRVDQFNTITQRVANELQNIWGGVTVNGNQPVDQVVNDFFTALEIMCK